jgi:protein LSM14
VSNGRQGAGGRRGGAAGGTSTNIKVPNTDFDFQSSNAKFDKSALGQSKMRDGEGDGTSASSEAEAGQIEDERSEKEKDKEKVAYNPQKSFFDSLSSSTQSPPNGAGNHRGRGAGGHGGRRGGKNRREEERERNVATFGEPGGVGLMGPGAYVGGWGGYGRRGGGGRPRGRGAGAVGAR